MKKKYLAIAVIIILYCLQSVAQSDDYVVHKIKKGESLSSLAKQFNTSVGDIMRLNSMNSKSVLKIGEAIKIPVNQITIKQKTNSEQTEQKKAMPAFTVNPTTHTVGVKETLYSISKKYNVTVDDIKNWNHLTDNNIHEGQVLNIGSNTTELNNPKPIAPVPLQPAEKKITAQQQPTENKSTETVSSVKKEEAVAETTPETNTKNLSAEGYFAAEFKNGKNQINGDAAVFKTASGWLNKKYYVLINNIPEGTIVKVDANNKTVFAKVLGALPNIKEDNGLLLRISNAAASVLGLADSKFAVTINY